MERLMLGNRVGLDANSSHLERLMDRGQHFCTYPASLPPQSITRQSIKSSKKPRKALAKALRVRCCFSVAAFICVPIFFFFSVTELIQSGVTSRIVLFSQNNLYQGYLNFHDWSGTYQSGEKQCCLLKDSEFHHLARIIIRKPGKTHSCILVEGQMLRNNIGLKFGVTIQ